MQSPWVQTVLPQITGQARVGQTLSATTGTWNDDADGGTIASYGYQWQRADDGAGTNAVEISGATASTHLPTSADRGKHLSVLVTATDAGSPSPGASSSARSAFTTVVTQAPFISAQPANVTVAVGQTATFTVTAGGFPAPTIQWERLAGESWIAISGAAQASHSFTAAAADHAAQFRAIASSGAGTAISNAATLTIDATTLPTPWSTVDIGAVGKTGSASHQGLVGNGEGLTLKGAGADIWGTADAFRFASQPLTGNGSIIARVVSQTNTHGWAKAGVMLRDGSAPGSRHAFMAITTGNGAAFQRRLALNGPSSHSSGSPASSVRWVKLVRSAAVITAYESSNGVHWTTVGTATWPMASSLQAGLAVTSHNTGTLSTAVFDNVQIIPDGNG